MALTIRQLLVPSHKFGTKCPYEMTPQYITIHNTANRASALAEISYMCGNNNEVSYHYAVDDKEAIQGLPLDHNGWHCGDGGSGRGNRYSIGIEICYSLDAGDPRYPQAEENGALLTAMLLKSYGWGIDRVRKHQNWSGKYCPHRILDRTNGWQSFLNRVQQHLNALNGTQAPQPKTNANVGLKSFDEVAMEVINGKWGNGRNRVQNLSQAGYDANKVQARVDALLGEPQPKAFSKQLWVHLPANNPTWAVYNVNGPYSVPYAIGRLAPAKFGGLDYHVERWTIEGKVGVITTQTFGKVAIYIARETGARWYEKEV